jgi:hypothetical protein
VLGIVLVLAVIGCAVEVLRYPARWLSIGAYLLAVAVVIVIPGRLYPHYFQLLLPPLAVASGWAVAAVRDLQRAWAPLASGSIACVALAVLLWHEVPTYRLSAEQWSRLKYGPLFIDSQQLGRTLDQLLPAGSTFYELGAESGLYFSSGRPPPSGVFYDYPLSLESPIRDELARRVVADLMREPPARVVVRVGRPVHPLIHAWVSRNYVQDSQVELPPGFALLRPGQGLAWESSSRPVDSDE